MHDAPVGIIDSRLFRDQFGTAEMRVVFSDEATLGGWLEAERALAVAQANLTIIPDDAAAAIIDAAQLANFDFDELRAGIASSGHPLVPVLRALERQSGEAGQYVHFGATTQDIIDTGMVLQMRNGLAIIERQLTDLIQITGTLARRHKATPIAGRTHGQHAVPTTFGFKLAVIVAELSRHSTRLDELKPRLLVGQLAGAAGTLATLGESSDAVRREMMIVLGLDVPDICWHTARDNIAECVFVLSLISASAGKFANEVINLQRTEIAEVAEPAGPGATGSSTMPQKRNPMISQGVLALSRLTRQAPAQALDAMVHEHERDLSTWQVEWAVVPQTFVLVSGALAQLIGIVDGLDVDEARMRDNLLGSGGLINAEAVMMRLASHIGRQTAHDVIEDIVKSSGAGGIPFIDALAGSAAVSEHLSRSQLEELLKPESWLGEAVAATDRLLDT